MIECFRDRGMWQTPQGVPVQGLSSRLSWCRCTDDIEGTMGISHTQTSPLPTFNRSSGPLGCGLLCVEHAQ